MLRLTQVALLAAAALQTVAHHADAQHTCGKLVPGVYTEGDVISFTTMKTRDECCAKCSEDPQCKLFTFGGEWKFNGPYCQLLRSAGATHPWSSWGPYFDTVHMSDFSGECSVRPWAACGNAQGSTCCPQGFYCQPWNPGFYQCMSTPAQCHSLETDTDFYGNDLWAVGGLTPDACCEQCSLVPECAAYTFVNDAAGGPQCYLKRSAAGRTRKTGALSGLVKRN
ncbi:hypothetical protein P43SY_008222 [Pythium insidiosum]|uniref:Apple domain-containing protein n=1 Tax=Pythium insidiosum TaxID=114742 RepID=A0AAD5LVH1_PYTIN|nr:hypothetical protein P43SY_008221 [Pythium insidiosum]KAJ0393785.1 hypothetical protein P43SY_008222 [Pythium insidiosum]